MQIFGRWWPKQKHEKFAKINLYYVHKFIEPLAQPEPAKRTLGGPLHTNTVADTHIHSGHVLAVFDMQISTVLPPPAASTPKITANQLWQDTARMVRMARMAGRGTVSEVGKSRARHRM